MGQSYVAIADKSDATYWNPAGLANLKESEIQILSTSAYETDYLAVQSAIKLGSQHIGLTYINATLDDIPQTILDSNSRAQIVGSTRYEGNAVYLGYGAAITPEFLIGINGKIVMEQAASYNASGIGADIGTQFQLTNRWRVGALVQNIIKPEMKWNTPSNHIDSIPTVYRIGTAYAVIPKTLVVAYQIDKQNNRSDITNIGLEFWADQYVAIRAGDRDGEVTFGLGLRLAPWTFDISWTNGTLDDIDNVYRFSLGYQFNAPKLAKNWSPWGLIDSPHTL